MNCKLRAEEMNSNFSIFLVLKTSFGRSTSIRFSNGITRLNEEIFNKYDFTYKLKLDSQALTVASVFIFLFFFGKVTYFLSYTIICGPSPPLIFL